MLQVPGDQLIHTSTKSTVARCEYSKKKTQQNGNTEIYLHCHDTKPHLSNRPKNINQMAIFIFVLRAQNESQADDFGKLEISQNKIKVV